MSQVIPLGPGARMLTTREAAQRLGVSLRTVQLWVEADILPAARTPGGHRRIPHNAVEALALSTGLASCLNAGLLFIGLRRRGIYAPQAGWLRFTLKLLCALLVMTAVLWAGYGDHQLWLTASSLERGLRLAALISAAMVAYFGTLYALGFRLRDFKRKGA